MFGMLAQVAGSVYGMYQQHQADKERRAEIMRAYRVTKTLAAESLAITYNSILNKSREITQMARRKAEEIAVAQRQAEGGLAVQAAQAGVEGKRAELAREQATAVPANRAQAHVAGDLKNEQDALILRADMEAKAMVSRLIQNAPDMPGSTVDVLGGVSDILGAYGSYQKQQRDVRKAITGSPSPTSSSTGVQLGLPETGGSTGLTWSPRG